MKIRVKVLPWVKQKSIKIVRDLLSDEEILQVKLTAKPINGEANRALIEDLAKYYGVRKSQINIIKGQTSQRKIIEIEPNRDN